MSKNQTKTKTGQISSLKQRKTNKILLTLSWWSGHQRGKGKKRKKKIMKQTLKVKAKEKPKTKIKNQKTTTIN